MALLINAYRALFDRLSNDEVLAAFVQGVFDYVPEESEFPCVVIREFNSSPFTSKTSNGKRIEFTIEVWNVLTGNQEMIRIIDHIEALLVSELIIEDAFFIAQEMKRIELLKDEETSLNQGKMMFELIIESE
ncbi:DUF3168 domain-containing protein [Cytobacillus purgationiresistens]|uniref:DUF3168 domain-containing protein n=1 Tax=Cytobacillus purgationiresistens TaxID=863449 RepID=A0ABU0AFZ0_9BACI|nr:DUF3168 domain-containing protein [Cytobacillus purgationiresistens]MDQ0269015.1 hypothetical protein [Cytobacillus purgationiresistens]